MTGRAHFAMVKPVKVASMQYLIARWQAQDFHSEQHGSANNADIVAPLSIGLSKENLYARMEEALDKGKKGIFMKVNQQFGLSMTSADVSVRGSGLTTE